MHRRWTEEEISILRKHYKERGANFVAKFVEHSPDTVMLKAAQLGLKTNKFRPWQKQEDSYLKRHFADRSYSSIAKVLKRTKKSISHRASLLKLAKKRSESWTKKELEQLKELYPNRVYSLEKIGAILHRSRVSVMIKARRMGFKRDDHIFRWSKRNHNYLVKNLGKKTNREIGEHLGIKTHKVDQYIQRKSLARYRKMPKWTAEEFEFLRNNFKKLPVKEIALSLNRSIDAVKNTASRSGLSRSEKIPWRQDEAGYLKNNYAKLEVKEIAENLNRSIESVAGKIRRMGLVKRKKMHKDR